MEDFSLLRIRDDDEPCRTRKRLPRVPQAAADFILGMRLRDYRFDQYKTKKKPDDQPEGSADVTFAVHNPALELYLVT